MRIIKNDLRVENPHLRVDNEMTQQHPDDHGSSLGNHDKSLFPCPVGKKDCNLTYQFCKERKASLLSQTIKVQIVRNLLKNLKEEK